MIFTAFQISLFQFSRSVKFDSLRPHWLQHARPPCPSPTPRVYSNSFPLNRWCHPTISSSVIPFSSRLQSFPASGSFQMSQFFTSGPKYWSFSFSISPPNEHSGLISFRMDWLDLLAVHGTLKSLLWHHNTKAWILWCSAFFIVQLSHPYMTTGKTIALTRQTFVGKVMSLLFNMLSRLVIGMLSSKQQAFFSFRAAVTIFSGFGAPENKVCHCFHCLPIACHEVLEPDAMIFIFWILSFKPDFSLSSFTFIKRLFSSSFLSAIGWCHLHIWGYWYFSQQSWFQLVLHLAQNFIWHTLHRS